MIRAPLIPRGCPSAIAPPFGLTFSLSSGKPNSRVTASACAAKASFNSKRSMFFTERFNLRKSFRIAGIGPMPISLGSTPAVAVATSSVAFGLAHFEALQLPALILFGLVLGVLAQRTGRLGPGIVAHATFNAVTVLSLTLSR